MIIHIEVSIEVIPEIETPSGEILTLSSSGPIEALPEAAYVIL